MRAQEGDMVLVIRDITVRLHGEHVQIMSLICQGFTYRQIGAQLGMCRGTVCNRVSHVKNELGTDSRVEALFLLRDAGVLK
jgi:DNA-binding NarL/FixJ family response regulator